MGQETLDKMKDKNKHNLLDKRKCTLHGLCRFVPSTNSSGFVWFYTYVGLPIRRFFFQDFDPFRDIVTEPKSEVYSDTQVKLPYYLGIYCHFNFSQLEIKDVFFFNRT